MSGRPLPVKVKKCAFCGELFEYKLERAEMCKKCAKEYHRIYVWTMDNLDMKLSDFATKGADE